MHAIVIALSGVLLGAGLLSASDAQARLPSDSSIAGAAQPASEQQVAPLLQLADGGKLADKYMAGKAGGAKGIGTNKKDGKK
jgi:hypothetical protein